MYLWLSGRLFPFQNRKEDIDFRNVSRDSSLIFPPKKDRNDRNFCYLIIAIVSVVALFLILWMVNNFSDIWHESLKHDDFLLTGRQWKWVGACFLFHILCLSIKLDAEFLIRGTQPQFFRTEIIEREFVKTLPRKTLAQVADRIYGNEKRDTFLDTFSFPKQGLCPQAVFDDPCLDQGDKKAIELLAAAYQKNLIAFWEAREKLQSLPCWIHLSIRSDSDPKLYKISCELAHLESAKSELLSSQRSLQLKLKSQQVECQKIVQELDLPLLPNRKTALIKKNQELVVDILRLEKSLKELQEKIVENAEKYKSLQNSYDAQLAIVREEFQTKAQALRKEATEKKQKALCALAHLEEEWRTFRRKLAYVNKRLQEDEYFLALRRFLAQCEAQMLQQKLQQLSGLRTPEF